MNTRNNYTTNKHVRHTTHLLKYTKCIQTINITFVYGKSSEKLNICLYFHYNQSQYMLHNELIAKKHFWSCIYQLYTEFVIGKRLLLSLIVVECNTNIVVKCDQNYILRF